MVVTTQTFQEAHMSKLALFDIDGVLADDRHRVEHAIARQWFKYFDKDAMAADAVWLQGRRMVQNAQMLGWDSAYMTGRREDRREITENWLDDNGFPIGRVIMRQWSQTMPLANLKTAKVGKIIDLDRFNAIRLYDDDPEVIKLVQETHGDEFAYHCTWHTKEKSLIKKATA